MILLNNICIVTMATITLEYDGRNIVFKKLIEAFIALGATAKVEKKRPNGLDKAIEDIEKGRVYQAKNVEDMFEQILK